MTAMTLLLLSLELTRFAPSDDSADALGSSLGAIESGGWTLSPYAGPAIQPVIAMQRGSLRLGLAPGLATRRSTASATDGRTGTVRATQFRAEARVWWVPDPVIAGVDLAYADGWATLDGERVAEAPSTFVLGPTLGLVAPIGDHLSLSGRARWPVQVTGADVSQALGGAIGLEWRR